MPILFQPSQQHWFTFFIRQKKFIRKFLACHVHHSAITEGIYQLRLYGNNIGATHTHAPEGLKLIDILVAIRSEAQIHLN